MFLLPTLPQSRSIPFPARLLGQLRIATGISEPLPVAQTFSFDIPDGQGTSLRAVSKLDCLVTVVDPSVLLDNISSVQTLLDVGQAVGENDRRSLCNLMIDQLEWANVILLNKMDLVPDETREPSSRPSSKG